MKIIKGLIQKSDAKIAIVVSEFNKNITEKLLDGALEALRPYINENNISIINVPGAVEIPFMAQTIAKRKHFDAIITLGAIIYGETDHYHHVCQQVSQGCQRIMLDESMPVIFGVLTVQSTQLALDRVGGKKGHMGIEAAEVTLKMLSILKSMD